MVATRSRQGIPRTVTANPRTRLCLRSGVIPRRTLCTWADLTAVIGFHPNLKPLQRHKGVPFRSWLCARDRNASSTLLWGPLPRHQHRISTVILATAAVYIRVGNSLIAFHVGCPVSRTCLSVSRLAAPDALTWRQPGEPAAANTPEKGLRFTTLVRRVPPPVGVSR